MELERYNKLGFMNRLVMLKCKYTREIDLHQTREIDLIFFNCFIQAINYKGYVAISLLVNIFLNNMHRTKFKHTIRSLNGYLKSKLSLLSESYVIELQYVYTHVNKPTRPQLVYIIPSNELKEINLNLPMVIPPNNWQWDLETNNGIHGGYLTNQYNVYKLKSQNMQLYSHNTGIYPKTVIMINKLHQLAWSYNSLINSLKYADNESRRLEAILGQYNLESDKMSKFERLQYYQYKSQLDILNILIKAYNHLYNIYNEYNIDSIYFNYIMCFRGRIYANGIISPTADKLLRQSLIAPNMDKSLVEYDATASILQILAIITCSIKLMEIANILTDHPRNTWTELFELLFLNKDTNEPLTHPQLQEILNQNRTKTNQPINIEDIQHNIKRCDRHMIKFTILRLLYGSNPRTIAQDFKKDYGISWVSYKHMQLIILLFKYHFPYETKMLAAIKRWNTRLIKSRKKGAHKRGLYIDNQYTWFYNTYQTLNKTALYFNAWNHKKNKWNTKPHEITIQIIADKIDLRKSNTSLIPNIFHSIDAGICCNIIEVFQNQGQYICTVHDAYLIEEHNAYLLYELYNEGLINNLTYIQDLIKHPKNQIITTREQDLIIELNKRLIEIKPLINNIKASRYTLKPENIDE